MDDRERRSGIWREPDVNLVPGLLGLKRRMAQRGPISIWHIEDEFERIRTQAWGVCTENGLERAGDNWLKDDTHSVVVGDVTSPAARPNDILADPLLIWEAIDASKAENPAALNAAGDLLRAIHVWEQSIGQFDNSVEALVQEPSAKIRHQVATRLKAQVRETSFASARVRERYEAFALEAIQDPHDPADEKRTPAAIIRAAERTVQGRKSTIPWYIERYGNLIQDVIRTSLANGRQPPYSELCAIIREEDKRLRTGDAKPPTGRLPTDDAMRRAIKKAIESRTLERNDPIFPEA